MRVLFIRNHFQARADIANLLLQTFSRMQVFEANNVSQGAAIMSVSQINLVLLDIDFLSTSELADFRTLFPQLPMVAISGSNDKELVFETLRCGVMGFIAKRLSRPSFLAALRDVLSGRVYLPTSVARPTVNKGVGNILAIDDCGPHPLSDPRCLGLTSREFDALGDVVRGTLNSKTFQGFKGEKGPFTNHLRELLEKVGVSDRYELLIKVFEMGIVFGMPEIPHSS